MTLPDPPTAGARTRDASRAPAADPAAWLAAHGDALYRYALLHQGDESVAEDLVQETLLAALKAHGSFAGRSSERTWLISILKHKLIDHLRRATRAQTAGELKAGAPAAIAETGEPDPALEGQFTTRGQWGEGPQKWGRDPVAACESGEFWDVLRFCLSLLPPRLCFVFCQRELDNTDNAEICKVLSITPTNLWTLLHRARTRLRRCLEVNWLAGGE
ncbi:MAG: sigma-70 family RNA polymerase sigma factor [Planctomycetota bacterium]